ncbi:hypothetical protein [Lactococcus termiticola]|uniref:DUF5648 domain-containing protein n=1 Tax=Lactococcus termiticola TaxID=2169526 RepID=A0A2R5HDX0_9LACT|nr:hypothetical protein [Lactococcus termiticola]GBG96016.1 hypothetical protein NtB2_00118 [Lactococcus termiticola]
MAALVALATTAHVQHKAEAATVKQEKIYRLYNAKNGEHLYTNSFWEAYVNGTQHGWSYEGVSWKAPKSGDAVHRLYNPGLGLHMYSSSSYEISVISHQGWKDEGVAFYSQNKASGAVPIYRLYNPNGQHLYSSSAWEKTVLSTQGWRYEGVAYYAYPAGIPQAQNKMNLSVKEASGALTITASDNLGTSVTDVYHPSIVQTGGPVNGEQCSPANLVACQWAG